MPNKASFRPLESVSSSTEVSMIELTINGQSRTVAADFSVAAAMLTNGVTTFRTTPVSGASRAPYCMMGACFECLVEIDGTANRQSCLVMVRQGMQVRSQLGAPIKAFQVQETPHAK